jgi:spore germination cell wall hydrolase CwlJ-like protein
MTTNQIYLAVGVAVFVSNVIYADYQNSRISTIENNLEVIHEDIKEIKNVVVEQAPTEIKYSSQDVDCLARNIYYEAGIESREGKIAVAQVTLNRVKSGYWGKNICKVVYSPAQFSWTKEKRRAWIQPKGAAWEESKRIADQVLSFGIRLKPLRKALFYHADYVAPNWRDGSKRIIKVGQHIFYTQAKGSTLKL